ncbi:MAG: hypothetical protein QOG59_1845 [Solirubrobacteraceae bacterium]|nr:hypothetical protein [Solirubrobacteraceae bacterium]
MSTIEHKIAAEVKVRELLKQQDVPPPDEIEYGHACIRLLWHEPKVALVVDLEPEPDDVGDPDG